MALTRKEFLVSLFLWHKSEDYLSDRHGHQCGIYCQFAIPEEVDFEHRPAPFRNDER